jgi:hypothetical protein
MIKKLILLSFTILLSCSIPVKKNSPKIVEEIEYEFIKQKIVIPIVIKGETYRFLFDTGSKTIISNQLKEKLIPKVQYEWNIYDGNNQNQLIESVLLDSLKIGTLQFRNINALAMNLKEESFECFDLDGTIGSDLLLDYIVQIDPKEKKIRFGKDSNLFSLDESKAQEMILIGDQGTPFIWIDLDPNENPFKDFVMVDTGMHGIYDLSLDTYERLLKNKKIDLIAKGEGAATIGVFGLAEKSEQFLFHFPKITINDFTFKNYFNNATKANNSRIGAELLEYGVMTFDFINEKFYFNTSKKGIYLDRKKPFFQPTYQNKKIIVGIVWDKSLKDKIQFGDQILEVNGNDLTKMNFCDLVLGDSFFEKENNIIKFKDKKDSIFTLDLK